MDETELIERGWRRCAIGQKTTQWCAQAEEQRRRDEELLRQVLDVLSRTHQTAMEQAMKARVLEGVVFAEIFQDLDFVVAALRERLGEGAEP